MIVFGVGQSLASRSRPFSSFRSPPRLLKLSVCGVGQSLRNSVRLQPLDRAPEQARGVGQFVALAERKDEQAFAPVRCADFRRRKQSCRKDVAHTDQFSGDFGKSEAEMIGDIFEEDDRGIALPDDAGDVRPEVARIGLAETATGNRERLTRVTRSEDIHEAAPWSAVEGCKVVPDRRRIQGFVFHPRHESGCCEGFPLDVTHSAISGTGDVQAEVEAACSCAERDAVKACVVAPRIAPGGR